MQPSPTPSGPRGLLHRFLVSDWADAGRPGDDIRLVTAKAGRVKLGRALVRWVAMNVAMIPLFAGFYPIAFGRRGFPDWLAHTLVLDAPQVSVAQARLQAKRAPRDTPGGGVARSPRAPGASSSVSEITRDSPWTDTISLARNDSQRLQTSGSVGSEALRE